MLKIIEKTGLASIDQNIRIARVFTEYKYEKLFQEYAIWFSNIDLLIAKNDPNERTVPSGFLSRMTVEQADTYSTINAFKDYKYKSYVSCWTKEENDYMWKTYDPDANGLAVITTVGKLMSEFPDSIIPCEVKYIDLNNSTDSISLPWITVEDNGLSQRIRVKEQYKDYLDFSQEKEIRFLCFDKDNLVGFNVPVNLQNVVNDIIINPCANEITRNNISRFISNYGFRVKGSSEQLI